MPECMPVGPSTFSQIVSAFSSTDEASRRGVPSLADLRRDLHYTLLSVHRCVQAGNKVVFAASGSYIEDETSGEVMPLKEQGGMYMLKLWVKAQGFGGHAEKP